MTKLTIKQLYGYSIMKWNKVMKDLIKLKELIFSNCSFCLHTNLDNSFCKINENICNCIYHSKSDKPISTNFKEVIIQITTAYSKLNSLIIALKEGYNEN